MLFARPPHHITHQVTLQLKWRRKKIWVLSSEKHLNPMTTTHLITSWIMICKVCFFLTVMHTIPKGQFSFQKNQFWYSGPIGNFTQKIRRYSWMLFPKIELWIKHYILEQCEVLRKNAELSRFSLCIRKTKTQSGENLERINLACHFASISKWSV